MSLSIQRTLYKNLSAWFILFLAIFLFLFYVYTTWSYPIDDAYISFRYAKNLAIGNGIVYNIGERVEGYSNFLWVLLNAIGIYLGFDPLIFSIIISLLSFLILIILFMRAFKSELDGILDDEKKNKYFYLLSLALFLLIADRRLFIHLNSGLETIFFTTLLFTSVFWNRITTDRLSNLFVLPLILLTLIRADGFVYTGIIFISFFINHLVNKKSLKPIFINLGIYFIFISIYILWRWSYYHDILPNTYYAKVTPLSYEQ